MSGEGVKPNHKLYPVNLDETCIKELIKALNSEKGVVVVARYNCANDSVSNNIQLPLTLNQQRNVREKYAGQQDAKIRITMAQVIFLKSKEGVDLLSSLMSLLPEAQRMSETSLQQHYKIYPVILDTRCFSRLEKAIACEKGVGVMAVLHYDRSNIRYTYCDIQLPLIPKQWRHMKAQHARQQDAGIRITKAQVKFLKSSEGSALLSNVKHPSCSTKRPSRPTKHPNYPVKRLAVLRNVKPFYEMA